MSMYRRKLMIANALKRSDGNINYPGLIAAWSAKGKTNDDADRAILKDLTGNGHDITLNGFAFSEMSGYGGYDTNFTNKKDWSMNNDGGDNTNPDYNVNYTSTYFKIQKTDGGLIRSTNVLRYKANKIGKFRFKINTDGTDLEIKQVITSIEGKVGVNVLLSNINSNEVYEIDLPTYSVEEYKTHQVIFNIKDATFLECWMLPEYPDALVFDGVDDYGSAVDFGGKKIKTVISKYQTINSMGNRFSIYFRDPLDGNNYKRIYTKQIENYPSIRAYSDNVKLLESYVSLQVGSGNPAAKPFQITGHGGNKEIEAMAFYSAYLFDRSLDEQEIKSFIRKYIDPEYLLPSEILTPDCYYDFSKGSNDDENRDTIKDYSGNGNNAVAHNFAWSGMSGYGGYDNIISNGTVNKTYCEKVSNTEILIKSTHASTISTFAFVSPSNNKAKFEIKGLAEGQYIYFGNDGSREKIVTINKDGIYDVDWSLLYSINSSYYRCIYTDYIGEINCTIRVLPLYEGALVFDGVDDYISLDAFDSGFKTMFMVCNPRNKSNAFLYDQRKNTEQPYDYGLYTYKSVAYNMRNANGTYINGIKNTKVLTKDLNNKKILISVNSELTQLNKPTISVGITGSYSDMALYKFLGFKKALTEEQIQAVIKKYNLLDGVDEIEVS